MNTTRYKKHLPGCLLQNFLSLSLRTFCFGQAALIDKTSSTEATEVILTVHTLCIVQHFCLTHSSNQKHKMSTETDGLFNDLFSPLRCSLHIVTLAENDVPPRPLQTIGMQCVSMISQIGQNVLDQPLKSYY